MLLSLSLIFLTGLTLGLVFQKLKLPALIGMLLAGMLLGPYVLDLLDSSILDISEDLRKLALIIILTKAGLNLNIQDLKKVGRPAVLLCFVPGVLELIGMLILAPLLLCISILEAALLGTVVAAVSPAVIVPRMLKLMEEGYGKEKSIPQMIMAGASVDDVLMIVLFSAVLGLSQGGQVGAMDLLRVPSSILLGLAGGAVVGFGLWLVFTRWHFRDTTKVIIILSLSFLLATLEQVLTGFIGFSGLLAIMALGITLKQKHPKLAKRLSGKFSKLWTGAEIWLFVLVGASVNLEFAMQAGITAVVLIVGVVLFRLVGVYLSLLKTKLSFKERLFSGFAYMPKATVQAAIGGLALSAGMPVGELVLTVAVVSILITAPVGAILIDGSYRRFLEKG